MQGLRPPRLTWRRQPVQHILLVFVGEPAKKIDNFADGVLRAAAVARRGVARLPAPLQKAFARAEVPRPEQLPANLAPDGFGHGRNPPRKVSGVKLQLVSWNVTSRTGPWLREAYEASTP